MHIAFRRIAPRQGHQAGWKLLERLYTEHVGGQMPAVLVTERGKPYFKGSNLHFSISHSKHHVFCVLSHTNVGIDAEEMDREIDLQLAQKILSPAEKVRYEACEDKRAALLKLWVLKEAAAKLSGEGLKGYPNHTDFDPNDPRVKIIAGCYVAILEQMQN